MKPRRDFAGGWQLPVNLTVQQLPATPLASFFHGHTGMEGFRI